MDRGMTADQTIAAIWRRKTLVGAIAVGVFGVGAAVVMTQPSIYEASAVVRVEPQRPSEEMVQRTVSELIETRLLTVRQELMARPVLEKAIKELDLYKEVVADKGIEAAVGLMRKDLVVKIEGENAFELTFSSRNPETAAKVANRLPAIFADETLKLRQAQAERATLLFSDEVVSLQKVLNDWEKKISQFKIDHMGELPEQLEMNMRGLERISGMMQAKSEELRITDGRRSDMARANYSGDSEAGRMQAKENALTAELVQARTTWTEDHPEIKRIENELAGIKSQVGEAEGRMTVDRDERARASKRVNAVASEMGDLQRQAAAFQARLDKTPQWAHELGVMSRDYDIAKAKYQSVVGRKVEAELAEELEAKTAKNLFNVISPASTPVSPARPDRLAGLLITLLVSLGLGVLTAIVLEMRDDSVRDVQEIRDHVPLPVLAVVPNLQGKTEKRVLLPATQSQNRISSPTSLN